MKRTRVLMVCTGNICRSPTAEVVLRHRLQALGLSEWVDVDSAGTHAWHHGNPPDERSIAHAARRGYDLKGLRARPVAPDDFETCDWLIAMDDGHAHHLLKTAPTAARPKVRTLMSFMDAPPLPIVPDPYYGGAAGFEVVLDLVEQGCDALARHLQYQHLLQGSGPVTKQA